MDSTTEEVISEMPEQTMTVTPTLSTANPAILEELLVPYPSTYEHPGVDENHPVTLTVKFRLFEPQSDECKFRTNYPVTLTKPKDIGNGLVITDVGTPGDNTYQVIVKAPVAQGASLQGSNPITASTLQVLDIEGQQLVLQTHSAANYQNPGVYDF